MNFHITLDVLSQQADESETPSTVEQPLLSLTTVLLAQMCLYFPNSIIFHAVSWYNIVFDKRCSVLDAEVVGSRPLLQEDVHERVVVLQDIVLTHRRETDISQHTSESCSTCSAWKRARTSADESIFNSNINCLHMHCRIIQFGAYSIINKIS